MIRQILGALISLLLVSQPSFGQSKTAQLRVGVITPLTGNMATIGTALHNGIQLARKENPEAFKNVEFVVEDDQFDTKKSLSAYQKLRSVDRADLIFGFGDTLGYAIGPKCKQEQVPLINFNFNPGPAKGNDFLVRAMNSTDQYMQSLSEYWSAQHVSRFTIVRAEAHFFNAMWESFRDAAGSSASFVELGNLSPVDLDFKPILLKARSAAPNPVGLFLSPEQLIQLMKQARELRMSGAYFGTDLFETAAGMAQEPALFDGVIYPDNGASDSFRQRYREAFNTEAQLTFAGSGYDMANLVSELSRKPNAMNGVEILNELRNVRDKAGALGKFSFVHEKENGSYFKYPVRVKRIRGRIGVPVD